MADCLIEKGKQKTQLASSEELFYFLHSVSVATEVYGNR